MEDTAVSPTPAHLTVIKPTYTFMDTAVFQNSDLQDRTYIVSSSHLSASN